MQSHVSTETQPVELRLDSGWVRGRPGPASVAFLDVPYAAPITAAGRFAPPRPHPGWSGVRDASRPGASAPQPDRGHFGALDVSPFFGDGWVRGEEYLTLNIWTPRERAAPAPVLVFVHGGAFIAGSNRAPAYDGAAFARDGVVFVAVNYRLGIPGFLSLPDAPDNRGCLDVRAALAWVQANAAALGGDAGNVTVAGQSAGAMIVATLMADPAADGLFRRAIVQSGSGTAAFTPRQARRVTAAVAERLALAPTAAALSTVPDERLIETLSTLAIDFGTDAEEHPVGGLVVVGPTLERQPVRALAASDRPASVDLLIGDNADEAALYVAHAAPLGSDAEVTAEVVRRFGARAAGLVEDYRAARPSLSPQQLWEALLSDRMFAVGGAALARVHAERGGVTYRYRFDWRSDALAGRLGACHLMELPFVFDAVDRPGLAGAEALLGTTAPPPELAARMHAGWVRFAERGDPGWPRFTPETELLQRIGASWETAPARPETAAA